MAPHPLILPLHHKPLFIFVQSHTIAPQSLSEAPTWAHSRQSPRFSYPSSAPASTCGQYSQCHMSPSCSTPAATPASTCGHSLHVSISLYPGSTPASTSTHSGQSLSPSYPYSICDSLQSLPTSPPCDLRPLCKIANKRPST